MAVNTITLWLYVLPKFSREPMKDVRIYPIEAFVGRKYITNTSNGSRYDKEVTEGIHGEQYYSPSGNCWENSILFRTEDEAKERMAYDMLIHKLTSNMNIRWRSLPYELLQQIAEYWDSEDAQRKSHTKITRTIF